MSLFPTAETDGGKLADERMNEKHEGKSALNRTKENVIIAVIHLFIRNMKYEQDLCCGQSCAMNEVRRFFLNAQ